MMLLSTYDPQVAVLNKGTYDHPLAAMVARRKIHHGCRMRGTFFGRPRVSHWTSPGVSLPAKSWT
jgi:hypothetical protein